MSAVQAAVEIFGATFAGVAETDSLSRSNPNPGIAGGAAQRAPSLAIVKCAAPSRSDSLALP